MPQILPKKIKIAREWWTWDIDCLIGARRSTRRKKIKKYSSKKFRKFIKNIRKQNPQSQETFKELNDFLGGFGNSNPTQKPEENDELKRLEYQLEIAQENYKKATIISIKADFFSKIIDLEKKIKEIRNSN